MKDLTKEEIGDIVHWLRFEYPQELQSLEEDALIRKKYIEILKSELMKAAEGGVTDRENIAQSEPEYKTAVRNYAVTQGKLMGLKAYQAGQVKAIDVWQTMSSNTRAGI